MYNIECCICCCIVLNRSIVVFFCYLFSFLLSISVLPFRVPLFSRNGILILFLCQFYQRKMRYLIVGSMYVIKLHFLDSCDVWRRLKASIERCRLSINNSTGTMQVNIFTYVTCMTSSLRVSPTNGETRITLYIEWGRINLLLDENKESIKIQF